MASLSYASDVKRTVLGVPDGPVVTEATARAMAVGARRVLGADIGLALTGVAGPDEQEGVAPGTVIVGLALPDHDAESLIFHLPGDREPRPSVRGDLRAGSAPTPPAGRRRVGALSAQSPSSSQ